MYANLILSQGYIRVTIEEMVEEGNNLGTIRSENKQVFYIKKNFYNVKIILRIEYIRIFNYAGITSCGDFSWMSRLRYYWVARDVAATTGAQAKGSKPVESTADEDSLAIGTNVELQMLHSKQVFFNAIELNKLK